MYHWMLESRQPRLWQPLAALGVLLVVFAAMIFVFPALLAYLIAAMLTVAGGWVLGAAWYLRKAEKRSEGRRVYVRTETPDWG